MKIVYVLENYIPHVGGVEIVFRNLCESLAKKGHDVSVITHRLKATKKYEEINGVKVYRVSCLQSRYLFTFLAVPKILKIARDADIIHTTTFNGAPPAWLASRLLGKKCLITVHEVWAGKWKELTEMNFISAFIHDILERMIYLLPFDKYVCVSESTKKQLSGINIPQKKIKVVYNGMDYDFWNPAKYDRRKVRKALGLENKFVYFFSGRPGVTKGLEYLIKAVPSISKQINNSALLAIVSKDEAYKKKRNQIIKMIENQGIKDKVMVLDPVPYKELPNYVIAADCVVVPSLAEGFGFVAAEACAMGKPVVASNTTSLPEVVSGKFVLVKPKSSEDIAKGVIAVSCGQTIKTKLKRFTLEKNINSYLAEYQRLKNG